MGWQYSLWREKEDKVVLILNCILQKKIILRQKINGIIKEQQKQSQEYLNCWPNEFANKKQNYWFLHNFTSSSLSYILIWMIPIQIIRRYSADGLQLYFCNPPFPSIMSSIKDKLKSKIKSRIEQPETMESFDENSVNVTLTQGKTQLAQIKLQCQWTNKNNMKNPKLKCRWYNRTENNLQEIIGVDDENYQPSILDVGSIIEITCQPELPGISYEGMPIQLKATPLTLAMETQNEATQLVAQGKGKFFVQLKEARLKSKNISHGCQSMIKIEGFKMVLCQMKFGQLNDDIIKEISVDDLFPQLIINRRLSRQITIRFNEQESCLVNFKNHAVRDVFCLVNKLIVANLNVKKTESVVEKIESVPTTPTKTGQKQAIPTQVEIVERKPSQQTARPIKQQVKSQNVLKEHLKIIENVTKQSAADLLQLGNLKQEIKQLEAANAKLLKQLQAERQKNFNSQNKLSELNQRLQNASRNYYELESQLKITQEQLLNMKKAAQEKLNVQNNTDQELLYYKNEIKLLSIEKTKMTEAIQQLINKNQNLLNEVQSYRKIYNAAEQQKSFSELENEMRNLKQMNQQLKMRYEYSIGQKDKIEEDLKNSRNLIEQIQAEKKYIEKKYESLANQISSPSLTSSKISDTKSNGESSLSSSYVFEEIPYLDRKQSNKSTLGPQFDYRQKQILQLKRQIKDYVEQNGYLRNLLSKQKKPSSKTQLKLQLFQVKKLVNRLSEALIQKDMCINNLKEINKELNKKNSDLLIPSIASKSSI